MSKHADASPIADVLAGRAVACAESCTAGRVAAAFAGVEEASSWFRGGLVAYQDEVKRAHLGVRASQTLSLEAAGEMARGVAELLDAEVAVATTGVAGDEPVDGVPPGVVFVGTIVDGDARTHRIQSHGDPPTVADRAAAAALDLLREHLVQASRARAG
jgi:PncC family amidohydrolase